MTNINNQNKPHTSLTNPNEDRSQMIRINFRPQYLNKTPPSGKNIVTFGDIDYPIKHKTTQNHVKGSIFRLNFGKSRNSNTDFHR